jgi:hypothetical protein
MNCALCQNEGKRSRGYWSAGGFFCDAHQPIVSPEDIYEMQKIDADCNDCIHFQRGPMMKVPGLTVFHGLCLKHDVPTKAYPGQFTGHDCFEHRRQEKFEADSAILDKA